MLLFISSFFLITKSEKLLDVTTNDFSNVRMQDYEILTIRIIKIKTSE